MQIISEWLSLLFQTYFRTCRLDSPSSGLAQLRGLSTRTKFPSRRALRHRAWRQRRLRAAQNQLLVPATEERFRSGKTKLSKTREPTRRTRNSLTELVRRADRSQPHGDGLWGVRSAADQTSKTISTSDATLTNQVYKRAYASMLQLR